MSGPPVYTPKPICEQSAASLIYDVIWCTPDFRAALDELHRRGEPLSDAQIQAAGLVSRANYEEDYADWWRRTEGGKAATDTPA